MSDVLADNLVIVGYVIFPSARFKRFTKLQDMHHYRMLGLVSFGKYGIKMHHKNDDERLP
jgi:hypothetical protein